MFVDKVKGLRSGILTYQSCTTPSKWLRQELKRLYFWDLSHVTIEWNTRETGDICISLTGNSNYTVHQNTEHENLDCY